MLLFAKRYLFSKKSHSVVNTISLLSLLSIATPIAAVIILLSVANGFGALNEQLSSMMDADLTVRLKRGRLFEIESVDSTALRKIEGVEALSFAAEQTMLLEHKERQAVATVRGVDNEYFALTGLDQAVTTGKSSVQLGDWDRALIGNSMAYQLAIPTLKNRELNLYALRRNTIASFIPSSNYNRAQLPLVGIYSLDAESESKYVITSLRFAQNLMQAEGRATEIHIGVEDEHNISKVAAQISQLLGDQFDVLTREELNPTMHNIIKYERWGIIFISLLVIILASFSLIGALVMLIIEKRDERPTLRAIGLSLKDIRKIFWMEGMLLSSIAITAGTIVGTIIAFAQQRWGFVRFPSANFLIDAYPVVVNVVDIIIVVAMSTAITLTLSTIVVKQMVKE